jgi:hypothetical protein
MTLLDDLGKFKNSPSTWAQAVHVLVAFTVMTQVPLPLWLLALGIMGMAALLEFWFDPMYEPDPFWPGGATDMAFYAVGTAAGWLRMAW